MTERALANGLSRAISAPRGPELRGISLTMRFVFDGSDPFERSIFAADMVRYDVGKAIDRVYGEEKVSFLSARSDESDEELKARFEALRGEASPNDEEVSLSDSGDESRGRETRAGDPEE